MVAVRLPTVILVSLLTILSATGTVDDCPPWFTLDNSTSSLFPQCVCSDAVKYEVKCDQRKQRSFVSLGFCVFQDNTTNDTVVADCPYVFPHHLIEGHHILLPNKPSELNHFICGHLNRDIGTPLCGRCTNGTGPSIYSAGSQCVSCSAVNIVYYLLLRYVPMTILFVAIIVFRIIIVSAPMVHYVLFCNGLVMFFKTSAISNNLMLVSMPFISSAIRVVFVLNAIWSFDPFFFVSPPLCVSAHMEEIYIPFLDALATLYPFMLLLLTYVGIELHSRDFKPIVCLLRPIHRTSYFKSRDPNASVIQAFATLFFLSYAKLTILIYEPLIMSVVTNKDGQAVASATFIDPTVAFYSHKHYYLISLSISILVFFILPPLLLLIVFPTCLFSKISRHLKPRWIISIVTFVDPFHSCYKDGTNGTRDYRAVSGYLLVVFAFLPALLTTLHALLGSDTIFEAIAPLMCFIALTAVFGLLKPYKHNVANNSGIAFFTIFALVTALYVAFYSYHDKNTTVVFLIGLLLCLPHCVFYGYSVYRLGKLFKQYCCKAREMEGSMDERLPCRPTNITHYGQLIDVSSRD